MNKNIINLLLALPTGTSVSDAQERADILKNRTDVIPREITVIQKLKLAIMVESLS